MTTTPGADAGARCGGAEVSDAGETEPKEGGGQDAPGDLGGEVPGHSFPRKVPPEGET